MSAEHIWPLIHAVYQATNAALDGIPGFTATPKNPPTKYWRIDGATFTSQELYKNRDDATHGITIHIFEAPSRSLKWASDNMAVVHAALHGTELAEGFDQLRAAAGNVGFDPREDGKSDAHAFLRFNTKIGA
jgi:hypothetical protein